MATASIAITPGSGDFVRVVKNSGVDSNAAQQVFTLADDQGDFLAQSAIPQGNEDALLVRSMPTRVIRTGFSDVIAGGVDPAFGAVRVVGSGMSVNQSSGNLVVTTGTTANSETIIRSTASFAGGVRLRCRSTLSQRIANQQFFVELVDVLGDGLSISIGSATAATVTFASGQNPFTASNVGQSAYLGAYSGSGLLIPGRYAIASVSGDSVTFTVSGFSAGSGTVSVFGWNYHHLIYSGTTATLASWGVGRRGWANTDSGVSINTSATPGHVAVLTHNDMQASVVDAVIASNTSPIYSTRGSAIENVPDDAALRVQIRVVNGSTAPGSSTTWTIGHIAIGNWSPQDVAVQDVRPQPFATALPVQVANVPQIAGITSNVVPGTGSTSLGKARSASTGSSDTGVAMMGVRAPTTPAAMATSASAWSPLLLDAEGRVVIAGTADPVNSISANINTTAATNQQLVAAAGTGLRNYITDLQVSNSSTTGTLVTIYDGAGTTPLWVVYVAGGASLKLNFTTPLRSSTATVVSFTAATSVTSLYVSARGYVGI